MHTSTKAVRQTRSEAQASGHQFPIARRGQRRPGKSDTDRVRQVDSVFSAEESAPWCVCPDIDRSSPVPPCSSSPPCGALAARAICPRNRLPPPRPSITRSSRRSSGAASDRIAAAARSPSPASRAGRRRPTSARSAAGCGRRPTAARRGRRSPTARSTAPRSAPSPSPRATPTSSSSAWASRASAATSCPATASTSRPTPARRGRTSASPNSDAISKIRIHPTNPDIVFVAAFGSYGAPSDERGVYKSTDGGKTWQQDAVSRRQDRRRRHRDRPHESERDVRRAVGGVPHRVPDVERRSGQRTVQVAPTAARRGRRSRATRACRRASIGKIGVARLGRRLEPRLRAGRERERRPLQLRRRRRHLEAGERPAAPSASAPSITRTSSPIRTNKDIVYALNTARSARRTAARRSRSIGNGTHGDHHDLWIDPDDPQAPRASATTAAARSPTTSQTNRAQWTEQDYPTEQFYHVITTKHVPYHVCGAQQDNSTLCVPEHQRPRRRRGGGGGGGGRQPFYPVGRRRARLHRARSEGPRRLLLRHEQRRLPRPLQPPHRRVPRGEPVSAVLLRRDRRARSSSAGSGPTRSSSRRSIRTCSTPRRSTSGRRPTAGRRGTRSAATSPATTRRRWGTRAGRSPTT